MNHAITVGGLLLTLGAGAGALIACFGILDAFACGMSDAPSDNSSTSGCFIFGAGVVLLIGCIIGLGL